VTLSISNQFLENCVCDIGNFGASFQGQNCAQCSNEFGVSCSKYNLTKPEVLSGYYRNPLDINSALRCIPSAACLNTSQFSVTTECADGYTGFLCGDCILGTYFKQGILCSKCPSKASQVISWIIIIVTALVVLVISTRKAEEAPTALKIAVFWIQILSIFPSLSTSWPPPLRGFLQFLSGLNFDIQFTSPGKLLFSLSISDKFHRMLNFYWILGQILFQNDCPMVNLDRMRLFTIDFHCLFKKII
jgi:hypothetical protein